MNEKVMERPLSREVESRVYCAICTHTVPARVIVDRRTAYTAPGQKCPRCASRLDAAVVLGQPKAA